MSKVVVGWTDTYGNTLQTVSFTEERKRALVERIRKRRYDFGYDAYQFVPYCCPVYDDGVICLLSKQQFDDTMKEAWKDILKKHRLLPMDVITTPAKNGVLYEKPKYEPKEGNDNV